MATDQAPPIFSPIAHELAARQLARLGLFEADDLDGPIRGYQALVGITPINGKLGPKTSAALRTEAHFARLQESKPGIGDYRGPVGHVLVAEGSAGIPYWPGGASGVTLDPGFDLGQHEEDELRELYEGLMPDAAVGLLSMAVGKRGTDADLWLAEHEAGLARLEARVAASDVPAVAARLLARYWLQVVRNTGGACDRAPAPVQMALLDMAYNMGPGILVMGGRKAMIQAGDWRRLRDSVLELANNASQPGLAKRRRYEALLIGKAVRS